jgi:hypothetical protein
MLKNISYRKKLRFLWIGTILMAIICYSFSISKTVDQYKIYHQNKDLAVKGNERYMIETLKEKNKILDETLDRFLLDTADNSKNLLATVAGFCDQNNITLKEYKPASFMGTDSVKLLTRSITLEGKFIDCLRLVYSLETGSKIGRISSVLFKTYVNPGETKTNLNCTVYIQNIISSSNEK